MLQWLHNARNKSLKWRTQQEVRDPDSTPTRIFRVFFFPPQGENHISDKSVTLHACLRKKDCACNGYIIERRVLVYRLLWACEVEKVCSEFRMTNVVILCVWGHKRMRSMNLYYQSNSLSRKLKSTKIIHTQKTFNWNCLFQLKH